MSEDRGEKGAPQRRGTGSLTPIDEQTYAELAREPISEEEAVVEREDGVVRVNTGSLQMPKEIGREADAKSVERANRVAVVIVTIAILFITLVVILIASGE